MQKNNSLTIAIRNALVCALAPTAVVAFTAQAQEDVVQDDVIAMETITVTAQALKVETPAAETPRADVEAVAKFWTAIGADTTELPPAEHDQLLAAASHTPHLVAAALAAATPAAARPLTAGGWRDTTRVAAGDPDLWTDILLDNSTAVAGQLDAVAAVIDQLRQAIAAGDRSTLTHLLAQAKESRDALGS